MNRKINVNCPYCGHSVPMLVTDDYFQKTVETCDSEEGGCGLDFVARVDIRLDTTVKRIEGEGDK